MMYALNTVHKNEIQIAFERLKDAALVRDFNSFETELNFINFQSDSILTEFEIAYKYYFNGWFLVHFGENKEIPDHLDHAKDLLTQAVDLFHQSGFTDEAVEAQITLGWSYFLTGEISSYGAFLQDALLTCDSRKTDSYFSVCVSLLIVYFDEIRKGQNETVKNDALQIITKLEEKIVFLTNERIKCQFYHNSARLFRLLKLYPKSLKFYLSALQTAQNLRNRHFEALTWNSLAHCYLDLNQTNEALQAINTSLDIFKTLKLKAAKANALDSKATILHRQHKYKEALTTINASLTFFREGNSWQEYAAAIWNKIEILYSLRKKTEIFEMFRELSNLAYSHLNLSDQIEYYKKFEQMNFIAFGKSFDEKRLQFEHFVIQPLLDQYGVTKSARQLGINHHQTLSNIVDRNPLIRMKKRIPRSDKNDIREITIKQNFKIAESINTEYVGFFQVSEKVSRSVFNQNQELILLVIHDGRGKNGDFILMESDGYTFVAELVVEEGQPHFVELETGNNSPEDASIFGRILGIAPTADLQNETIYFQKI